MLKSELAGIYVLVKMTGALLVCEVWRCVSGLRVLEQDGQSLVFLYFLFCYMGMGCYRCWAEGGLHSSEALCLLGMLTGCTSASAGTKKPRGSAFQGNPSATFGTRKEFPLSQIAWTVGSFAGIMVLFLRSLDCILTTPLCLCSVLAFMPYL